MKVRKEYCLWSIVIPMVVLAAIFLPAESLGQISPNATPFSIHFPHFAVGGGYATTFTFINTGDTNATGALTLRDPNGDRRTPLQISIRPGGINTIRMEGSDLHTGWASYEGEGGNVSGIATFELAEWGGSLKSIAGVQALPPMQNATIAVDYDPAMELDTAYAIANPGTETISIRIEAFSEEGVRLDTPQLITLLPGRQISRYAHQDFPSLDTFRGTAVFSILTGNEFIITTLAQNRGLYTVMPVAAGAANR